MNLIGFQGVIVYRLMRFILLKSIKFTHTCQISVSTFGRLELAKSN